MITQKSKNQRTTAMMVVLAVASSLALSAPALAMKGGGPGNGGDAVLVDGKWTLLDLAEAGIKKSESFEKDRLDFINRFQKTGSLVKGFVEERFDAPGFSQAFKDALSATIENSGLDRMTLFAVMRMYRWELTELPLTNVGDEQSTIDLEKVESAQLAVRLEDRIQIYAPVFAKMDLLNQVSTVIHEIAYALAIPEMTKDGYLAQLSPRARGWVSEFMVGKRSKSLTDLYRPDGKPVFEGSNSVRSIHGILRSAGQTFAATAYTGDRAVMLCDQGISSFHPVPQGRATVRYTESIEPGRNNNANCYTIGLMAKNQDERKIVIMPERNSYESIVDSLCKKGLTEMYLYLESQAVVWRFITYASHTGETFRPVVLERSHPEFRDYAGFVSDETIRVGLPTEPKACADKIESELEVIRSERERSQIAWFDYYARPAGPTEKK